MTNQDINRRFAKLCGLCWHELTFYPVINDEFCAICSCGKNFRWLPFAHDHERNSNPDFITDPRLVLREMDKHPQGRLFYASLIYGIGFDEQDDEGYISRDLMTDTTGLLVKAAIEWIPGGWMKK